MLAVEKMATNKVIVFVVVNEIQLDTALVSHDFSYTQTFMVCLKFAIKQAQATLVIFNVAN